MSTNKSVVYAGGRNIAMKVPPHQWDDTVRFYREILRLPEIDDPAQSGPPSVGFVFGPNRLWIDRVAGVSQAELWLQVTAEDTTAAARHLADAGVARCDEIEPLPEGSSAFWITGPSSVVHLVSQPDVD